MTVEEIINLVSISTGLAPEDITSPAQHRELVEARDKVIKIMSQFGYRNVDISQTINRHLRVVEKRKQKLRLLSGNQQ